MSLFQYQQYVIPIQVPAAPAVSIEWWRQPDQPTYALYPQATYAAGAVWVPQHQDAEGSDLGWTPRYPDQIFRFTVRAADQPFFTTGVTAPILPVPDLSWNAIYPDQIDRLTVRAADQPFFTTGATHSALPVPDTSWTPQYPSFLWRVTLPTGAIPSLFVEPFPRPGAALLSAWAFYPDQIDRQTLHPSRMPYHVPGPLVPIPDVFVGVIDDKIHLGTKESLGVTAQPTLGGWQAW